MNKLNIKKYGRFYNASFDLSQMTVFFGGNEAGKTTIFDAIFEQLCSASPKRGSAWSRLTERYGNPSERQAEADVAVPYDSGDEFLSLFAVRASDISLSAGKDAWTSAAGRKIFLQGIDIAKITDSLRKVAEPRRASNDARHFEELQSGLKAAETELEIKQNHENEAAGRKQIIRSLEDKLASIEQQISAKKEQLAAKTEKIEKLKDERQLGRAASNREFVSRYVARKKFCEENPLVSPEFIAEYDTLVRQRDEAKALRDAAAADIKSKEQHLAEIERKLPEQEKKRKEAEMLEGAASNFQEKVQDVFDFREKNNQFKETPIFVSLISPLIAIAGAAAAIYFHSYTFVAWLLIPAGIVLAWLFHKNFVRRRNHAAEKEQESQMISEIINSWSERFDASVLQGLPPEQILVKFSQFAEEAKKERDIHKSMLDEKEKSQMAITDAMANSSGVQIAYDTARFNTEAWLRDKGFADRDSYLRASEKRRDADEYVKSNCQAIEKLMSQEACMSAEALLGVLDSRVKAFEKKGISPVNADDIEREIARQENASKDIRIEIMDLEEAVRQTAVEKTRTETDFENSCSKLPEEIASIRSTIFSLKEKIAAEQVKRSAASLAADVLSTMDSEASSKFKELARKAASYLNGILPSSEIRISGLSVDGIQMKDAQGGFRSPDMLSSGTRDCLMLGMRLCLAEESFMGRDKVMLFDDPFINLDDSRTEKALEVLRRFHASSGCQIIFFTKETRILQLLSADWRVKVHKL